MELSNLHRYRQNFFSTLIALISEVTGTPVGLYEMGESQIEEIIPEASRARYEPYCKKIQSYSGGKERCEKDQRRRAKSAFESNTDTQTACCWAGVYNKNVLVKIKTRPRALIVYGEMQIEKRDDLGESFRKHEQAAAILNLDSEQKRELRDLLKNIKKYDSENSGRLDKLINGMESLMNALEEEHIRSRFVVDRNYHEISTRLTAVLANASNLKDELEKNDIKEARIISDALIRSTYSLHTVVQNLDDYMEKYKFRRQSIRELIYESVEIYKPEANLRQIELHVSFPQADKSLYISPKHLQYAINNLIHNAIKYSFDGRNKNRYVNIEGRANLDSYKLTISNYGVGILPEELEKIFRDNYQGELTKKEHRTGAGKGLYFVKRTIDRHYGRIQVTSSLRAEAEETPYGKPHINHFTIFLPYYLPEEVNEDA